MIGGLHEWTTRSSSNQISHFAHSVFVANFEPKDVAHALSDSNWVNAMHEELENIEQNQVDKTLFLLKHGNNFLLVEIYVDDIIFVGSSHALVAKFAETMSKEFKMSMMGELNFFLGLQIKQTKEGTFIHQSKYTKHVLRKFDMTDAKPMSTLMPVSAALDVNENGEAVDQKEYRSMIAFVLNFYEARHTIILVSVRSFSSVSENLTSPSRQADYEVYGCDMAVDGKAMKGKWRLDVDGSC
ncbi:uncharacterized protein LOC133900218 [Phragmites australis]|uniref:uncharacterized protein LOC133900218 n=1 Tax=Phragmites australis TaxID=29695 RepID=UPI002D76DA5F|nr:uncharacterized protein LOC133900218 [Phragmites australis]